MKKQMLGLAAFFVVCVIFLIATIYPRLKSSSQNTASEPVSSAANSVYVADIVKPSLSAFNTSSDAVLKDEVLPVPAAAVVPVSSENQLVVADFDTGDKPSNLGGDFGAWNKDPEDTTQGCTISFETDDALGDSDGYSLKLDYDVESDNPAYNGLWMKLDDVNASSYNTLSFYVRGEGLNNYTKRIKLELKDSSGLASPYIVSGITESWQKVQIPFERFRKIQNWSSMGEFVIVFDDMNSDPEQGTIMVDQIAFEKR